MAARTNRAGALLLAAAAAAATAAAATATSEIRASAPDELDAHCLKASHLRRHANPSCSARLGRRFASAPIWEGATLYYATLGSASARFTALGDRSVYLPFTRADLLADAPPTWSDVFDGGIEQRIDVAARVFQDPVRAAPKDAGGIQTALNGRCEAREMFKYAARLDGCMTGLDRIRNLHGPATPAGGSRYEMAEEASGLAETGLLAPSVAESSLLSMWLADQCRTMPSRTFDRDLRLIGDPDGLNDLRRTADALKPVHDAAMAIAARAGDPWAVQAFFVKEQVFDVEYWKSLSGFDPLLCHRWMAAHVGSALGLDPREQAVHALRAFSTVRRTWPDLELDSYYSTSSSRHTLDPTWRDGNAPPDASAIDESLVHPWDTTRGEDILGMVRSASPGT